MDGNAALAPQGATVHADVALVGGGLASSLIALRLAEARPDLAVHVFERMPEPDDSHTWCLFETDVTAEQWRWLAPLFDHVWDGYEVVFPEHRRRLSTSYACLSSRSLGRALKAKLGDRLHRGVSVIDFGHQAALCEDGLRISAPLVVDARGPRASSALKIAYQKFVGLEVRLRQPHGLSEPVVMDGAVRQADGYRFIYLLPFGPDRLLIEDTRYSDTPHLDVPALEREIDRYARASGWQICELIRREGGVLPVALGGDIEAYWRELGGAACVGLRGAFFHPTTGYSLPEAVRTAELVAQAPELTTAALAAALKARSVELWRRGAFSRALNRMMFLAAEPQARYRVLERFYRLPQPLIERFYAGRPSLGDKARILAGRPPVPVARALAALPESALERAGA